MDADGHVKLTDFGLSKEGLDQNYGRTQSFCGTTEYLAPEIIKDKEYSYSVDIYCLGLVLYEMITGVNPFKTGQDTPFIDMMNNILDKKFEYHEKLFSPQCRDICEKLLAKDVRIS